MKIKFLQAALFLLLIIAGPVCHAENFLCESGRVLTECGRLTFLEENKILVTSGDRAQGICARLTDDVLLFKGARGVRTGISALKNNPSVTLYCSEKMTRSIPPETRAYAIIIGEPSERLPKFIIAEKIISCGDAVRVLDRSGAMLVTIDASVCKNYRDIVRGDALLVWSDTMTLSIPAQLNAKKIKIIKRC